MNDLEFYKYIYDRELNRRSKLDESINVVIGTISLLIGLISYLFSNDKFKLIECDVFIWTIISVAACCIGLSISYLIKSYNNYLKGFDYPNISYLKSVREYQKVIIPNFNNTVSESEKINFENELIDRLIRITDENTKINDRRSYDLYISKTFIILTLILAFIISIILITKNTQLC